MTPDASDAVGRPARYFVTALTGLIVVFAASDVEVWPLTGWRLFSTLRDETQTEWVAEATNANGESRIVSYEELPLGFRNAAWVVDNLPDASADEREDVCQAILDAILDVEPETVDVRVARNRARLEERDGEWIKVDNLETLHTCQPTGGQA